MNNNVDRIITGDCLPILRGMDSNSVDSIVTDPPYGLGKEPDTVAVMKSWIECGYHEVSGSGFMGKSWDAFVPQPIIWKEAYRVLKPGGHILSFFGTRTYDLGVISLRFAGFEIRDQMQFLFDDSEQRESFLGSLSPVQLRQLGGILKSGDNQLLWVYGSGFPKSLDVSKSIMKMRKDPGIATGETKHHAQKGVAIAEERGAVGGGAFGEAREESIKEPTDPDAIKWRGFGSALKPANEPICLARKPLEGTIAGNVLAWGTGGLNIDGCRIGTEESISTHSGMASKVFGQIKGYSGGNQSEGQKSGRFPANVIHDGSDEATSGFPNTTGSKPIHREEGFKRFNGQDYAGGKEYTTPEYDSTGYLDSGSASRYFYCAKSSKSERNMGLGLDCTCTIKYIIDTQTEGVQRCKDVNMVLVQLLQRATSDMEAMKWHIGESGESIMGLCLLDSLSTTLTEISKITELKILDLLTHSLIRDCIAGVNCETGNGGSPVESAGYLSKSLQTITPEQIQELARGVRLAVLPMLSIIKDVENWKPLHNIHSTVKPIALMRYLCRLITPPNGIVLDPYAGSGSTCVAAVLGGFHYIGCEREEEYVAIAERRIKSAVEQIGMGI